MKKSLSDERRKQMKTATHAELTDEQWKEETIHFADSHDYFHELREDMYLGRKKKKNIKKLKKATSWRHFSEVCGSQLEKASSLRLKTSLTKIKS